MVLFEEEAKSQPEKPKQKKTFYKVEHKLIDSGHFKDWSKPELLMWLVLRRFENEAAECFPGYKKIIKLTGLHRASIARALRSLEERGAITVERKNGVVNHYKIAKTGTPHVTGGGTPDVTGD